MKWIIEFCPYKQSEVGLRIKFFEGTRVKGKGVSLEFTVEEFENFTKQLTDMIVARFKHHYPDDVEPSHERREAIKQAILSGDPRFWKWLLK